MGANIDPEGGGQDVSVTAVLGSGRRAILIALRRRLAGILDGSVGHERGCDCECGAPFDAGKIAPIVRELRAVIAELDDLPEEGGGSEVERVKAEREARRQQARAEQDQGES
jgi:hypothetical protein